MKTNAAKDNNPQLLAQELQCFVPDSFELKATGNGPLSGYKFVAKDMISIAGHTSSFGHPRWRETHTAAKETAPIIRTLLDAGADMLGLAKLDQLAYSLIGNVGEGEPPLNSLYKDRFTGGSSSGSASAIAGGIADFGIGTDTAGSIRVPAAACGLFSIRPTHSIINIEEGILPWAQSLDVVGIFTRSASTLQKVFETISNHNALLPTSQISKILVPEDVLGWINNDIAEVIQSTTKKIADELGIQTRSIEFDRFTNSSVGDILARLQSREIWKNHSQWVEKNKQYLDEDVRMRLERCQKFSLATEEEKQADIQARKSYVADYEKLIGARCVVMMPIIPNLIPLRTSTIEERHEFRLQAFRLMAPGSLCGAPQIVFPAKFSKTGQTFGVSLLGMRGTDLSLLETIVKLLDNSLHIEV